MPTTTRRLSPYYDMHSRILADRDMTPDEKFVLIVCTRFGSRGRGIHPGAVKLAALTGHHPEAVRRILKRLQTKGKIVLDMPAVQGRLAATWRLANAYLPRTAGDGAIAPDSGVRDPNARLVSAGLDTNSGLGSTPGDPNSGLGRPQRRVGPSVRDQEEQKIRRRKMSATPIPRDNASTPRR